MTLRFSGVLFICARVVSFAALARHYAGANKQYSLKIHVIPLLSQRCSSFAPAVYMASLTHLKTPCSGIRKLSS